MHVVSRIAPIGMLFAIATSPRLANADTIIKQPNSHLDYRVELEPHLSVLIFRRGFAHWKGKKADDYFGVPGIGAGFRASIELADPAFIPKLNNTIAIGFGIDVASCAVCNADATLLFPLSLQWNFYITKEFDAFGEVGPTIRTDGFEGVLPDLNAAAGGRLHFTDAITFTFRVGYPMVTAGVSFLL
jgi:hypothetical protein